MNASQDYADTKTCPYCAELIKAAAIKCKHCGADIPNITNLSVSKQGRTREENEVPSDEGKGITHGDVYLVSRDIVIDGQVAFKENEKVEVEGIEQNPQRPEYKYVVLSRNIQKRFQLSDRDIINMVNDEANDTSNDFQSNELALPKTGQKSPGAAKANRLRASLTLNSCFEWCRNNRKITVITGISLSVVVILAIVLFTYHARAPIIKLNEYHLSVKGSSPNGIVAGPDNAMWFTETVGDKIGRITTTGAITEYSLPDSYSPNEIAAGPDGALWFTSASLITRVTTSGVMTEFAVPTHGSFPYGITVGPDQAMWFTEPKADQIGRITMGGFVTEYPVSGSPFGITKGPDGALWFTEGHDNQIGRITTTGSVQEWPVSGLPTGITPGPDGALWFTEYKSDHIGRITTSGEVSEFALPSAKSGPGDIVTGSDSALWFTEQHGNRIGRITTTGGISEYPLSTAESVPAGIASGPNGCLWFTEVGSESIGKATLKR